MELPDEIHAGQLTADIESRIRFTLDGKTIDPFTITAANRTAGWIDILDPARGCSMCGAPTKRLEGVVTFEVVDE